MVSELLFNVLCNLYDFFTLKFTFLRKYFLFVRHRTKLCHSDYTLIIIISFILRFFEYLRKTIFTSLWYKYSCTFPVSF